VITWLHGHVPQEGGWDKVMAGLTPSSQTAVSLLSFPWSARKIAKS